MKVNDFVGMLFLARDVTHSVHLNTRSYAKHKALNEFYDGILEIADELAEVVQGEFGLLDLTVGPVVTPDDISSYLNELAKLLKAAGQLIPGIQSYHLNIIDEALALIYKTRYLLTLD